MSLYDELSAVTLDSSSHSLLIETPSSVQTHSFNAQAPLERRLISPPFHGQKDEKQNNGPPCSGGRCSMLVLNLSSSALSTA